MLVMLWLLPSVLKQVTCRILIQGALSHKMLGDYYRVAAVAK